MNENTNAHIEGLKAKAALEAGPPNRTQRRQAERNRAKIVKFKRFLLKERPDIVRKMARAFMKVRADLKRPLEDEDLEMIHPSAALFKKEIRVEVIRQVNEGRRP